MTSENIPTYMQRARTPSRRNGSSWPRAAAPWRYTNKGVMNTKGDTARRWWPAGALPPPASVRWWPAGALPPETTITTTTTDEQFDHHDHIDDDTLIQTFGSPTFRMKRYIYKVPQVLHSAPYSSRSMPVPGDLTLPCSSSQVPHISTPVPRSSPQVPSESFPEPHCSGSDSEDSEADISTVCSSTLGRRLKGAQNRKQNRKQKSGASTQLLKDLKRLGIEP